MINKIILNLKFLLSRFIYSLNRREKNLWVFGEWNGERCCDNCLYFANYVAMTHSEIRLIWITGVNRDTSILNPNVKCIEMDSPEAICYLKKAGAVFMVHGMSDLTHRHFIYYSGAVIVNFWHGIPWKKIQADMYSFPIKKLYWKYLSKITMGGSYLSTSEKFDNILQSAFACNSRDIVKAGYPRNSLFYNADLISSCKAKFIRYINSLGVDIDRNAFVITYMPTFRDKDEKVFSIESLLNTNERLREFLKSNNAIIIQKSHFVSYHRNKISDEVSDIFIQIKDYPTQELLASSDILITDYSSCFFDFLLLDRPIIHFLYDYEYYANDDRGLYYKKEDVACGEVAENADELVKAIENNLKDPQKYHELRKIRKNAYLEYESSLSCNQIFSRVKEMLESI